MAYGSPNFQTAKGTGVLVSGGKAVLNVRRATEEGQPIYKGSGILTFTIYKINEGNSFDFLNMGTTITVTSKSVVVNFTDDVGTGQAN
jgi:hypothetical protein